MSESDLELYFTSSNSEETDTTFTLSTNNSLYESDIDEISISSSISCKTEETMLLFDSFEEHEIDDIIEDIYEQLEDCYTDNILKISSPKFYKDMVDSISTNLSIEWVNVDICDDNDFQQIVNFVEDQHESYLAYNSHIVPRSISNTSDFIDKNKYSKKELTTIIEYIKNQPQPAQRTPEWYEFRNSLLSASNLWKALGSQAQMNSLIYEKCKAYANPVEHVSYGTSNAMHWGVKYEPVTIMIYEDLYKTKVGEFGCIRHSKYHYVGASPDGINILPSSEKYGTMLEIKNIVNREITGIPKEEYWIQTQIQMETCDLDKCDFVETRIKEHDNEEDFYKNSTNTNYRGIVLHFINNDFSENDSPTYIYMPLDIPLNPESIDEWIIKEKEKVDNMILFNTLYWYLDEISCVLIQRNRAWFSKAIHHIKDVWDTIEKEKVEGYEHRSPKRRIPKMSVTIDDISGSHTITNIPSTNKICLIKLDSK